MSIDKLWTATEIANFQQLDNLKKLFKGEHEVYYTLPSGEERRYDYIVDNMLGDFLSHTWKRFLFRQFPKLVVKDEAFAKFIDSLDLPTLSLVGALRVSYAGRAVAKGYYSNLSEKVCWVLWGLQDGEYTTFEYLNGDKSRPIAVSFWYTKLLTDSTVLTSSNSCMIRERHSLVFDTLNNLLGVRMINTAHSMLNGVPTTKEVDWRDEWGVKEAFFEDYTDLPVVTIDNIDKNGDGEGDTDYTPTLISIQKNINKVVAVRQFVIDLSESPQLLVPPEYIDSEGNVDWDKAKLRIKYDGEEDGGEIKTIGWTGNLENSDKQWEFYREEFRALTGISPILAGVVDNSQARSGIARRISLVATEAEISSRRHQWNKAYKQLIKLSVMINNAFSPTITVPDITPEITWPSVIPGEDVEKTNMIAVEVQTNIRSRKSAIDLLPLNENATDEWKREELDRVLQQVEEAKVIDPLMSGPNEDTNGTSDNNQV